MRRRGCPTLLTLSVAGRVGADPGRPVGREIAAAFNAHQRRTRRRTLLGPDAVEVTVEAFPGGAGCRRPSPWRLGADQAELRAEWFEGWIAAACDSGRSWRSGGPRKRRAAPGAGRGRASAGCPSTTATCSRGTAEPRPPWPRMSSEGNPEEGQGDNAGLVRSQAVERRDVDDVGLGQGARRDGSILHCCCGDSAPGAFLDGLYVIDGGTLLAACGIGLLTTVFSAWRWCLVARGLGIRLPLGTAPWRTTTGRCSSTRRCPAAWSGTSTARCGTAATSCDAAAGVRAVAWERSAGQFVQVVLTVAVLLVVPSPVRAAMPLVALALLAAAAGRRGRRRACGPTRRLAVVAGTGRRYLPRSWGC